MARLPLEFHGLYNSNAEPKTPPGRAYAIQNANTDQAIVKMGDRYTSIGSRPSASVTDVCFGLGYGKFGCNETQSLIISGIPTGGTVVLRFNGHNTATIAYNSPATDVQTALQALSDFQDGEIVCSGGPWPLEPVYATFRGRYTNAAQALITLQTNSLTGGTTPTLTIAHYVTGGPAEEYLVVIQPSGAGTCTLYKVTSADGFATTTWTSAGTGLAASDWFFEQYQDRIYAANSTDGLTYKQLGGAWAGTLGISGVQNPTVIPAMSAVRTDGTNQYNFTGATFGNFVGWGTDPTITVSGSGGLKVVLNAALTGASVTFDATLSADVDWSHQDYHLMQTFSTTSEIVIDEKYLNFQLINSDGSPATLDPTFVGTGERFDIGTSSRFQREFHWGSRDRALRDNVRKVRFAFSIPTGTSAKNFTIQLFRLDTWPNDRMDTLALDAGATLAAPQYAYSYLKASTSTESKLSPTGISPRFPSASHNDGLHIKVTVAGSPSLTTSDYIKVYRKDRFGLFRFIGAIANVTSGTTFLTDTNILDEIEGFPSFGIITLPGGFLPTNLGSFKGSLVVAADRKIWLSYVGRPLVYAPDPDDFAAQSQLDTTDPNIPRTVFMAANRAEDIQTIIGQDSLYLTGPSTCYAMTNGGTPQELDPPRPLPGSRGCIGTRAAYKLSGGSAVAAKDGLWYYAVSAGFTGVVSTGTIIETEMTAEVRQSWDDIFGSGPTNAIVAVFNEETYAISGRQYLKFTRSKQIEQGTYADSVKAVFPTQLNGFVFVTAAGVLMRFGEYTSDNGASVTWSYTTGKLDGPRTRIQRIECQYRGTPSLLLECWDGAAGYDFQPFDLGTGGEEDRINFYPVGIVLQGVRYRLTISGQGADTVEGLAIEFEDASKGGKGN